MRRDLTVTVADSHIAQVEEVARCLEQSGMQVGQILTSLGIITGSIEESQLSTLETIEGVAAIERQKDFQLPPPDADVQ